MNEEVMKLFFDNKFIKVIAILVLAFAVSFVMRKIIDFVVGRLLGAYHKRRGKEYQKRAKTLASAFGLMTSILVWLIAFLVGLNVIGLKIETLLTSAGLFGVIISFGAQTTIRDVLAGIWILAENQFRVGDVVKFYYAGQQISGTVEEITLRVTKLRDAEGNLHIVRNGFSEVITNRTFNYAKANIELTVEYNTDIDLLEKVIDETGEEMIMDPSWRHKIIEPIKFVRIADFEASGIRVKAIGKVEAAEQWKVSGEYLRRLKKAFEKHKIAIAYDQVVVHQVKK